MPTVHRERGYSFRFYPSDGSEPPHVHVVGNDGRAKLWLEARVSLAYSRRYNRAQIRRIEEITERERARFLTAWRRFFT